MAFGKPCNPADIVRVSPIVGNQSRFGCFIQLPQLDDLVLAGSDDPGVPVLSTKDDIRVSLKEGME